MANYYESRYRELRAEGLLDAAVAVAPLFQAGMDATAAEQELGKRLGGGLASRTRRPGLHARAPGPPRLRVVPAGPSAAGCLERRDTIADNLHTGARASAALRRSDQQGWFAWL